MTRYIQMNARCCLAGRAERASHLHGFTLIEMMIVVAIIAILASVAYPSYMESIRKGKRAEAKAAMTSLLQQQERYLSQNGTYLTFGAGGDGTPFKTYSATDGGKGVSSHLLGARACQKVGGVDPSLRDCIEIFAEVQKSVFSDPIVDSFSTDSTGRRGCNLSYATADLAKCWK